LDWIGYKGRGKVWVKKGQGFGTLFGGFPGNLERVNGRKGKVPKVLVGEKEPFLGRPRNLGF